MLSRVVPDAVRCLNIVQLIIDFPILGGSPFRGSSYSLHWKHQQISATYLAGTWPGCWLPFHFLFPRILKTATAASFQHFECICRYTHLEDVYSSRGMQVLGGREWSASRPGLFNLRGEKFFCAHCLGDLVGHRDGLGGSIRDSNCCLAIPAPYFIYFHLSVSSDAACTVGCHWNHLTLAVHPAVSKFAADSKLRRYISNWIRKRINVT